MELSSVDVECESRTIQNFRLWSSESNRIYPLGNYPELSKTCVCVAGIKTELKCASKVSVWGALTETELKCFSDVSYAEISMVSVCGVLIKTELKCFSAGKLSRTIHGFRLWSSD